jgi:hypothetical protein
MSNATSQPLRVELHDAGDPLGMNRPLAIRQRQSLKHLLRRHGLRAKWWVQEIKQSSEIKKPPRAGRKTRFR